MGLRTGKEPEVSDSFMWRICHALDEPPRMLAKNAGVEFKDLAPLLEGRRGLLAEVDRDHVWWAVSDYVNKKLGLMLGIKEELNRALQSERVKRATKLERYRNRGFTE